MMHRVSATTPSRVASIRHRSLVIVAAQRNTTVPRRWRQNKRLAPALLAGLAAATVAQHLLPADAAVENQQPARAIDLLASAGDVANLLGIDLVAPQDLMGGVDVRPLPAGLLGPAQETLQGGPATADPGVSLPASFRHRNEHGFCYSRVLCGARSAAQAAEAPATGA